MIQVIQKHRSLQLLLSCDKHEQIGVTEILLRNYRTYWSGNFTGHRRYVLLIFLSYFYWGAIRTYTSGLGMKCQYIQSIAFFSSDISHVICSVLGCFVLNHYLLGKGGYVFGSVGLSVCLFVCGQHYSKSYEWIGMKGYGGVWLSTVKN